MIDLCFKSLVSCMRIMVGLSCKVSIRSMMHGRLELMWLVFHVIIWMCVLEVCVCCVGGGSCVVRVVFWVWCESNYGVATFDELMDQLVWNKWESLLELLLCDVFFMDNLLINIFISGCGWGGWRCVCHE